MSRLMPRGCLRSPRCMIVVGGCAAPEHRMNVAASQGMTPAGPISSIAQRNLRTHSVKGFST